MNKKKNFWQGTAFKTALIGAVSALVLVVSYLKGIQLHAEGQFTLIPLWLIVLATFLLLELLLFAILYCGAMLIDHFGKKNHAKGTAETETSAEAFRASEARSQEAEEAFIQRRKEAMKEYVHRAVAPILEEEDMQDFWNEYEAWIDDSTYKPTGRRWKWKQGKDVKHLDMRHLTWNLAKRMGMDNGYNTVVCGAFIKEMFPDLCSGVEVTTLSQCLKADGNKGYVVIDNPDPGDSIAFHYHEP